MLQITNLFKKYVSKDDQFELSLDFEIPTPSFVVITGESGSGKSTFAKILSGMIPMNHGTIKLGDEDITANLDAYVEYLEANEILINNFTVYQTLYAKCNHLYDKEEVEERIERVCSSLKLTNLKNQKIIDLSGGEAQRVAVGCMMLSAKPILILDEATHSLDKNNSSIIVNMLEEVKDRTIIYITHKPEEVEGMGDIYFHFENGKIIDRKVVNEREDGIIHIPSKNNTKVLSIVKSNFFTGIKGHIQTSLSYLLLFFLCSCFLAIGTFVTSINVEAVSESYNVVEYPGSDRFHTGGVCGEATKYNVEVHSSYTHHLYWNEIEELKEKFGAVDAIENFYSPYYKMLADENGEYDLHIAPLDEKNLFTGRMYENKKEVVISVGETDYSLNRKYFKSLVGKRYGEYTIVGIIKAPHDARYIMYLDYYASQEDFQEFQKNFTGELTDNFIFCADEGKKRIFEFREKDDFMSCVIDNTLPDNTVASSKVSEEKRLDFIYTDSYKRYTVSLDCIPSEHILSMNETTFKKFTDEEAIGCTKFYFHTFKECETFIEYLSQEGIPYSFYYHKFDSTIQILCNIIAFILIVAIYFGIGMLNRKINRSRDLFYDKCGYHKKKLWFAKVLSSTIMALISIFIYAVVYSVLAQVKYTAVISFYALRWMTLTNWFILAGLALVLHICVEMLLEFIPRKNRSNMKC